MYSDVAVGVPEEQWCPEDDNKYSTFAGAFETVPWLPTIFPPPRELYITNPTVPLCWPDSIDWKAKARSACIVQG